VDLVALIIAVVAVVFAVIALRRTARPSPGHRRPPGPVEDSNPTPSPGHSTSQTTPAAPGIPDDLRLAVASSLRHVSVVRYDAFADVTGLMSFTAAVLDDNGDGFVITSLHSRTDSRTLLKGISAGTGEGLSPEEQQAVDYATGVELP